jgi:hypothetical protein
MGAEELTNTSAKPVDYKGHGILRYGVHFIWIYHRPPILRCIFICQIAVCGATFVDNMCSSASLLHHETFSTLEDQKSRSHHSV